MVIDCFDGKYNAWTLFSQTSSATFISPQTTLWNVITDSLWEQLIELSWNGLYLLHCAVVWRR